MTTSSKFINAAKLERFRGGVLVQQEPGAVEWEAWVPCSSYKSDDEYLPGISLGSESDLLLQGRWYKLLCQGVRENGKLGEWEIPALNFVVKTPGTCGGRPRLDNTRMDVKTFVQLWNQGASDGEILNDYPSMTDADLWVVREWLKVPENAAEIAESIEQEER